MRMLIVIVHNGIHGKIRINYNNSMILVRVIVMWAKKRKEDFEMDHH